MQDIKLPAIELSKLDENLKKMLAFRDLLNRTIDLNPKLSDGQVMQYFKTYIRTMDSSYCVVWELLNSRYDKKRMLINT